MWRQILSLIVWAGWTITGLQTHRDWCFHVWGRKQDLLGTAWLRGATGQPSYLLSLSPLPSLPPFLSLSFFLGIRFWNQSLTLAKQVLYHLSRGSQPFFVLVIFQIGSHEFCLGLALDVDSPTSTSPVTVITDVFHHVWLVLWDRALLNFCFSWPWTVILLSLCLPLSTLSAWELDFIWFSECSIHSEADGPLCITLLRSRDHRTPSQLDAKWRDIA
jgi:hypothetical protein